MKRDLRFPGAVAVVLVVAAGASAYPLQRYASPEVIVAVVAGALLSTVNVLLGFLAIERSFERSYTTFLKYVIGGMGLRLLLMLGGMILLILAARVQAVALVVSMLVFYVVYLVMEIAYIHKKMSVKHRE